MSSYLFLCSNLCFLLLFFWFMKIKHAELCSRNASPQYSLNKVYWFMDLFKICIFNCNIVSSTSRFSYLIILTTLVLELSEHALQDRPFGQVKPNSNHKSKSRDLILFCYSLATFLYVKKI